MNSINSGSVEDATLEHSARTNCTKRDPTNAGAMFITVYYGNQKTLLCNPSCTIINLLNSIKERSGYNEIDQVLDLTDETGLVLELDNHKSERATKYLTSKERYILVEKRVTTATQDPGESDASREVTYVPLLQRPSENFPQYEARLAHRNSAHLQQPPSRGTPGSRHKRNKVKSQRKSFHVSEKD